MVINNDKPVVMTVSEVIQHNADQLVEILKAELKLEEKNLNDKLHARTLEQIFIENRIYKRIEEKTTSDAVIQAVFDGLKPFHNEIKREVTTEDVETLLEDSDQTYKLIRYQTCKERNAGDTQTGSSRFRSISVRLSIIQFRF